MFLPDRKVEVMGLYASGDSKIIAKTKLVPSGTFLDADVWMYQGLDGRWFNSVAPTHFATFTYPEAQ